MAQHLENLGMIPVPAAFLREAGRALYGDRWQMPLAKTLREPSPRRLQRWAAAAKQDKPYHVTEAQLAQLLALLEPKVFQVQRAYETLKAFYDGQR